MKTPKVEEVKMPYASTVASFYNDQGAPMGNSFLGRLFAGVGARPVTTTSAKPPATTAAPANLAANAVTPERPS